MSLFTCRNIFYNSSYQKQSLNLIHLQFHTSYVTLQKQQFFIYYSTVFVNKIEIIGFLEVF